MQLKMKTGPKGQVAFQVVAESDSDRFVLTAFARQLVDGFLTITDASPLQDAGPDFITIGTRRRDTASLPFSLTPDQRRQINDYLDAKDVCNQVFGKAIADGTIADLPKEPK